MNPAEETSVKARLDSIDVALRRILRCVDKDELLMEVGGRFLVGRTLLAILVSHTKCIYCGTESARPFRAAEHVIPQAFGKFDSREGNPTLHNVCPECNRYFGQSLEQYFGRDTGEAFLRLLTGLKPMEEADQVGGRRLTFRIDEPGTEFDGAWVELAHHEQHGMTVEVLPQARFRSRFETSWRWYREADLIAERLGEFRHAEMTCFGSEEDCARMLRRLEEIGCPVLEAGMAADQGDANEDARTVVEVRYALDEIVLRTIAKIAFNYLAFVTEKRVPGFVQRAEFDPIRQYIRHGTAPGWDPVAITQRKILLGDTQRHQITNGHLVAVSWPDPRRVPIGKVSLFNQVTYVVQFTKEMPGIWWELDSGHHFDITTRQVSQLTSVNPMFTRI